MSDPILPPVICQKIKGYTYVRTYKNVRVVTGNFLPPNLIP
ncbi:MAG: hypothetical protein SPG96_09335 [Succinivibrio sp.]|nr:hypothetical protein [Succinivibrio sp.]